MAAENLPIIFSGSKPLQGKVKEKQGHATKAEQYRQVPVQREGGKVIFYIKQININGKNEYCEKRKLLFNGKILFVIRDSSPGVSTADEIMVCASFCQEYN